MSLARLLFPALRWSAETGFAHESERIDAALALGVGGFILFGGEAEAVRELTRDLHARSAHPLLIGSDLERGAGQQFRGATSLPPLAALGALDELGETRRAGELTAREARALGVNWVYGPVADLANEPENPIVGTRAFGGDPERVSAHVAAWIEGCRAGGALSCAKHFPGHGRTTADSHAELPTVAAGREALEEDLRPFRAAVEAGVDSVMTAHVAFPALDPSGTAATLSGPILTGLLREGLGFDGLVVTDALIMEGVLEAGEGEANASVRALAAGCDALLYPEDLDAVLRALEGALGSTLPASRVAEAAARIEAAAARVAAPPAGGYGSAADRAWAEAVALRSVRVERGWPALPAGPLDLVTIDDDLGSPYPPPPRDTFLRTLREGGVEAREAERAAPERPAVVAVYADIKAWKGRPGLSAAARAALETALAARPDAVVVLFAHPRLAADLPGGAVVAAWGGEVVMQAAAARWLLEHRAGA